MPRPITVMSGRPCILMVTLILIFLVSHSRISFAGVEINAEKKSGGLSIGNPLAGQDYPEEYFNLRYDEARYFLGKGMYKEAEFRIKDLLRIEPNRTEIHYLLATIYFKMGRGSEALKEADYALQNPEFYQKASELRREIRASIEGSSPQA